MVVTMNIFMALYETTMCLFGNPHASMDFAITCMTVIKVYILYGTILAIVATAEYVCDILRGLVNCLDEI
jgi:hypothetical protein